MNMISTEMCIFFIEQKLNKRHLLAVITIKLVFSKRIIKRHDILQNRLIHDMYKLHTDTFHSVSLRMIMQIK